MRTEFHFEGEFASCRAKIPLLLLTHFMLRVTISYKRITLIGFDQSSNVGHIDKYKEVLCVILYYGYPLTPPAPLQPFQIRLRLLHPLPHPVHRGL
jgi:hypothetical protein